MRAALPYAQELGHSFSQSRVAPPAALRKDLMMMNSTLALMMLSFVACASASGAAPVAPNPQGGAGAETAVSDSDSLPTPAERAQSGPLLDHGFVSIRTLPHAIANPARDIDEEYRRAAREVGVSIVDGIAFAQRFYDQAPPMEQHPIDPARADEYLRALAQVHPRLRLEDGLMAQPQTFFLRSLTVEGPDCLIPDSPTECTYFDIAARPPGSSVSSGERSYSDAFNEMIELTTQLVDEVFPVTPAAP